LDWEVESKAKWEQTRGLAQVLRQCQFRDFSVDEGLKDEGEMSGRGSSLTVVQRRGTVATKADGYYTCTITLLYSIIGEIRTKP